MQGDVYPKVLASGRSAQRGSVQIPVTSPGDPLTPGKPAIPGVPRFKNAEVQRCRAFRATNSYGDARHLWSVGWSLRRKAFRRVAISLSRRRNRACSRALENVMDYQVRKIWDVISRIDGEEKRTAGDHGQPPGCLDLRPQSIQTAHYGAARSCAWLRRLVKKVGKPRRMSCFAAGRRRVWPAGLD